MASTSEKGHAKNIANLKLLITNATALDVLYNPSNGDLKVTVLQAIYDTAFQNQKKVNEKTGPYQLAVANRENFFKPINKFITKLRKVYKTTQGVQPNQLDNFMTIARKIKGESKTTPPPADTTTDPLTAQHSTSQMSFDQRTNNFELLIALLDNTTNYGPNETEYQIATLQGMQQKMLDLTDAVQQTYVPLNNARSTRNNTLYLAPNNLVDMANLSKNYIASILDTNSAQYKAIAKIKFNKI